MSQAAPIPVVASDAHLAHDGLVELLAGREVPCFEAPARAIAIRRALDEWGGCRFEDAEEHGIDPITAVHDLELVDLLEHVWDDAMSAGRDAPRCLIPDTFRLDAYVGRMDLPDLPAGRHDRLGAYCFDTATPIVAGTYAAARASVDIALTALDLVVGGERLAYALCRPPGHHAGRNLFGGYCYFNNAAIVAQRLVGLGAERVAILDLDFHHGNGTQQIFWERGEVLYVSLHGDPRAAYPYFSGSASETGAGRGAGATRNLPLPPGTAGDTYLDALADALAAVADFDADAPLVISIGFDTFKADPICDFALETDDYRRIGAEISRPGRSMVAIQEGGYAVEAIGANALAFLGGLAASAEE
jgi:acetoin utilization deacetylase AcuC-like enzyme